MVDFQFRPIQQWPRGMTQGRKNSQFQAGYSSTLTLLSYELDKLDAKNVVIQLALDASDIRQDGLPRASAKRPAHPGVIVSFDSRKTGPVSFPCDAFFEWKDNLRGIAMTLERLRLADLYGVTRHGEQYKGWAQLPAPEPDAFRDASQAARWLSEVSGVFVSDTHTDGNALSKAFRAASLRLHPDQGGSHEQFLKLQNAAAMLKR